MAVNQDCDEVTDCDLKREKNRNYIKLTPENIYYELEWGLNLPVQFSSNIAFSKSLLTATLWDSLWLGWR